MVDLSELPVRIVVDKPYGKAADTLISYAQLSRELFEDGGELLDSWLRQAFGAVIA